MIDKTLAYLDYIRLLDIIKQHTSTAFAAELVSALRPLEVIEDIQYRQDKLEAILEIVSLEGKIPLSDIPDIRGILKRLAIQDAVLGEKEFIAVLSFLSGCSEVLKFLKRIQRRRPYVETILAQIDPLQDVFQRIAKTVNMEGFLEDTASYDLSRIRADLFVYRDRIRRRLEKIMEREAVRPVLQDVYISLRNGRYVVPLKPNFNEVFQGIVHDYSHTLKTSFVEPMEVVEMNNSINMLEKEEKEEEKRVLRELTESVRGSLEELEGNSSIISHLDLNHAVALFSSEFGCVRPLVKPGGVMEIKSAINPFIRISKKDTAVPIDISVDRDKKVMILSGPNAGGKTVALKTIGLFSLMAQSGLFIPARGNPEVPLFTSVHAVIGDEQDISMELSSFTAHIKAIKELYAYSRGGELILVDEIGGGTDPQEAAALSMGIIDAFVERGCMVIVTTHLNQLKAYGYTRSFAINVATASDPQDLKPLYKLIYGLAGYSNAITVAKGIDIPAHIIERSNEYLGKQETMLNDLITALEEGKRRVDEELNALAVLRNEAKKRVSLLQEKRAEYLKRFEEKCNAKLLSIEAELENLRREAAKKERSSIQGARARLKILRKEFIKGSSGEDEKVSIGDYVTVKTLGINGVVTGIGPDEDTYEVSAENVRTRARRAEVERSVKRPVPSHDRGIHVHVEPLVVPEINVIGMRVEDALREVDKFVDRAIVQGMPKLKVLHGVGTGRLMNAIRDHLGKTGFVAGLVKDERNAGVTIVELQ
jgi:DNA mismatch repair protein MutS2